VETDKLILSQAGIDFIVKMLDPNVDDRPDAVQCLLELERLFPEKIPYITEHDK